MKKLYTLSILALLFNSVVAQQPYTFTHSTVVYSEFSGTQVLTGQVWDDPSIGVPIGFDFQFYGEVNDSLFCDPDGLGSMFSLGGVENNRPLMIPIFADLVDRGLVTGSAVSPIRYITTGASGNRIFKIQIKNAGFYGEIDDDNVSTDFINFQIWLYESNNNIEFRYGSSLMTQPSQSLSGLGVRIGLLDHFVDVTNDSVTISVEGHPSNPTSVYDSLGVMSDMPPSAKVYTFVATNLPNDVVSEEEINVSVYPNPTNRYLTISADEHRFFKVMIVSLDGKQVKSELINNSNRIDVSDLSDGFYFLELYDRDYQKLKAIKFSKK